MERESVTAREPDNEAIAETFELDPKTRVRCPSCYQIVYGGFEARRQHAAKECNGSG